MQDAEDLVQETLLAAWRGLDGYGARASLRTWLYRIATNRCLNALRDRARRPRTSPWDTSREPPEPTRRVEPIWLEPYPDAWLDGLPDAAAGPDARYETREAIGLATAFSARTGILDRCGLPPTLRATDESSHSVVSDQA